jgi:hypothetical protein
MFITCHAGIGAGALRRLCRLQHKAVALSRGPLCECRRHTTVHRSWVAASHTSPAIPLLRLAPEHSLSAPASQGAAHHGGAELCGRPVTTRPEWRSPYVPVRHPQVEQTLLAGAFDEGASIQRGSFSRRETRAKWVSHLLRCSRFRSYHRPPLIPTKGVRRKTRGRILCG